MSEDGAVVYRRKGRVAYIELDRPQKLNALSEGLERALCDALLKLDTDDDAWVGILSGAGRAFSSGGDVMQRQIDNVDAIGKPSVGGVSASRLLYELQNWKPIISAVHGYCLGMAFGLMLQTDLVVVTEDAQLQISEIPRGIGGAGFWRKLQFLGAGARGTEIALTGRLISGREAFEAGFVNQVVPEGEHVHAAEALADEILENPPLAVRSIVRARRYYMQESERETSLLGEGWKLHLSEDFRASAQAFAERRTPGPYAGR